MTYKQLDSANGVVAAVCVAFLITTVSSPSFAADTLKPVTIRIASDFSPAPHPAGISLEFFKERLKEAIPGSELRIFTAGALYKVPEAVEAMTDGNLEMTWGQFGKSS
jgi:TRAP-type C4-dicarboxylate transport system substrate-binding protein